MDENLEYVRANFLAEEKLAERSGVACDTLPELFEARLLPRPSYFRGEEGRLSSNLGQYSVQLDSDYHHPSSIPLARHHSALLAAGADAEHLAGSLKDQFISAYVDHLQVLNEMKLVDPDAWRETFATPAHRRDIAAGEFGHWLAGTYGLCTRYNSPQAIAVKECMVSSIDRLTDKGRNITESEKQQLAIYLKLYDAVAALFAPFERPTSSGNRLRVVIPERYGIDIQQSEQAL